MVYDGLTRHTQWMETRRNLGRSLAPGSPLHPRRGAMHARGYGLAQMHCTNVEKCSFAKADINPTIVAKTVFCDSLFSSEIVEAVTVLDS